MGITAIHLDNFEQHASLRIDLTNRGVNCICGANGAGKSTIVRAIDFAFTGEFHTGKKTRKDHIRWKQKTGSVYAEFEAEGQKGTLERNLHGSGTKLVYGGMEYESATAAEPVLTRLIGGQSVFSTFGILQQGKLDELLTATPATRKGLLQTLYGLENVEARWTAVGGEQAAYAQIVRPARTPEIVEDELRQVRSRLLAYQLDRQQLGGEDDQKREQQLETADRAASAEKPEFPLQDFVALQAQVAQEDGRIVRLQEKIQGLLDTQQLLSTELAELQAASKAVQAQEQAWKSAQYALGQAKALAGRKSALVQPAVIGVTKADVVKQKTENQELLDKLATAKAAFKAAKDAHTQFAAGTCPTCGTCAIVREGGETELLSTLLDSYHAKMNSLIAEGNTHAVASKAKSAEIALNEQQVSDYDRAFSTWKSELAAIERDIAALPDMTALAGLTSPSLEGQAEKAAEIARLTAELRTARESGMAARTDLGTSQSIVHKLCTRIEEEKAREVRLQSAWQLCSTDHPFAPAMPWVLENRAALKAIRDTRATRAGLDATIAEIESQILHLEQEKIQAAAAIRLADNQVRYSAILAKARAALHRDAFGTAVLRRSVGRINTAWNRVLCRLGQDFTIRLTPELEIDAEFGDDHCGPESLSGGQRTAAAFAFAVASQQLIKSPLATFIADEPTYGLDDERISLMAAFIPEIQQLLASEGSQMILISHEARVRDAAETSIQL